MECPVCGTELVRFGVPEDAGDAAPGAGRAAAICPGCLALEPADDAPDYPAFDRLIEGFPEGETGARMALACGLIADSVALNRATILELFGKISDTGTDPWLVLERLAGTSTVEPGVDLARVKRQLEQLG